MSLQVVYRCKFVKTKELNAESSQQRSYRRFTFILEVLTLSIGTRRHWLWPARVVKRRYGIIVRRGREIICNEQAKKIVVSQVQKTGYEARGVDA